MRSCWMVVAGVGVTDEWVYDDQNVVALSTDGVLAQEYLHRGGLDTHIALLDHAGGTAAYYYHTDALGTVRALSDATKAVAQSYTYTGFGVTTVSNPSGLDQPFRYTAREWDDASGLYYYRARYYDPAVGSFISADPIGLQGGVNSYRYVDVNPLATTDALGLMPGDPPVDQSPFGPGYPPGFPTPKDLFDEAMNKWEKGTETVKKHVPWNPFSGAGWMVQGMKETNYWAEGWPEAMPPPDEYGMYDAYGGYKTWCEIIPWARCEEYIYMEGDMDICP